MRHYWEREMWKYILVFLAKFAVVMLIILIPVRGGYELCRMVADLGSLEQYTDIPCILLGAVQSIPRIGNFLGSFVSLFGLDFSAGSSLEFTVLEEIVYMLLTALFAPMMYRIYRFFAGQIDILHKPKVKELTQLTNLVLGTFAVFGSVSLAMLLRDTLSFLMQRIGYRRSSVPIIAIIGILLLITVVGNVATRRSLPMQLLFGIVSILMGILQAGCMAMFANACLLLSNSTYLTSSETAAAVICLIVTAVVIVSSIYLFYWTAENEV